MHAAPPEALGFILLGFIVLAALAFAAVFLGFWVWMLIDCAIHTPSEGNLKLVWVLIIVFTGWIGALIYFFVQRPKNRFLEGYRPT
jgi:ABC-type multidrug transport system fused ATPase/permease subunit